MTAAFIAIAIVAGTLNLGYFTFCIIAFVTAPKGSKVKVEGSSALVFIDFVAILAIFILAM